MLRISARTVTTRDSSKFQKSTLTEAKQKNQGSVEMVVVVRWRAVAANSEDDSDYDDYDIDNKQEVEGEE